MVPLYGNQAIDWKALSGGKNANPGLVFDKFPDGWKIDGEKDVKLPDGIKKEFFESICKKTNSADIEKGLESTHQRRKKLVETVLGGKTIEFTTQWRFVSGLGSSHPYETSFIWHRTLGVPYLPGSAVKGMVRAWAAQWDEETNPEKIKHLFGPAPEDPSGHVGALIVFDALPTRIPALEVDILNPHYRDYYDDPENNPPADYISPVPVFFLTVAAGQSFNFSIAPRPGSHADLSEAEADLEDGVKLLNDVLMWIGAGGKTSVGYGRMRSEQGLEEEKKQEARQWLADTLEKFRNHKDNTGQPEENLWKKQLASEWSIQPSEMKPIILELIKVKWAEMGIDWNAPKGSSAAAAKNIFSKQY